ncbi:MAG: hypothetical protein V4616_11525 [Bacteroidota bacterium]
MASLHFPHRLSGFDFSKRLELFQLFIAAAFTLTVFISPTLWIDHRLIPTAAAFGQAELPEFLNYLLIGIMLCAAALAPFNRTGLADLVCALCIAVLVAYDLQRFQLEVYLFFLWWLTTGLYKHRVITAQALFPVLQLTILATYITAGIMKLNPWFSANVYSWVISPLSDLPGGSLLTRGWILAPLSEIGLGLLLCFRKTRVIGAIASIGFHGLMLYLFGPFGNNYHRVMWPMQAVLPLLVLLLFSGDDFVNPFRSLKTVVAPRIAVILLFILPFLHLKDWSDSAPSFATYDGRHYLGYVAVESYVVRKLPAYVQKKMTKVKDHDKYLVPLDNWVSEDLGVPFYHEKRVYMRYKHWLEPYAKHPGDVFVVLMKKGEIRIVQDN